MRVPKVKNLLKPFGQLDVLLYYAIVGEKLRKFLKGKELASKIHIPPQNFSFLKRGSKDKPLYIEQFLQSTDIEFIELRNKIKSLKSALPKLKKDQETVWSYFVPRKLVDFFYATNKEGVGKPIERVFFDLDVRNIGPEKAQEVALGLIELIQKDKAFKKLFKFKIFVMWTGKSFHVYLMFSKPISHTAYDKYIGFNKSHASDSFTGKWAAELNKKLKVKVTAGHEATPNAVNIDPSQSPSGKLCRAPFSLHMKDASTIDGIAIPLKKEMLKQKGLITKLRSYTPEKVVKELNTLAKNLP